MTAHGVKIQDILSYEQTNYDLTLVIVPGHCLQLRVSYQGRQFATAQMKRLMRHLEEIIAVIVQQPGVKASEITVLSQKEKDNILQEWTFTASVETVHPDQEEIYAGVNDPSSQTEIYILDPHGHPLPIGIAGEICIGSADLKRHCGSWSEWMMENAIPHPFDKRTGDKLYKTGDLGMWKEDGTVLIVELI
jgi:acyl-CoA synthetase (AMP-forming)/AMP-acid ligase II